MIRYAFVVDNRRCIGCHACSVACKAEHGVPLGVYRTWVKYVEKGTFPSARRHFLLCRCNHCMAPPCVAICPVGALFQRPDGIVDFDPDLCIGCKACMQACPYDAIYLDPDRGTAAKCNFCAPRLESGLLPICAAACPAEAIVAGDLADPESRVSRLVAQNHVTVRKPEKGTGPMLFYVAAEQAALSAGAAAYEGSYISSAPNAAHAVEALPAVPAGNVDGARVVYDVEHARPWGWQVPTFFLTKSASAGVFALPALAGLLGVSAPTRSGALETGGLALLFLLASVALLVLDLSRPERFLRTLTRARPASWVALGAWFLVLYGALAIGYAASALLHLPRLTVSLLVPTALGALFAAVYTAFLLGQCQGRALWQMRLLPWHLVVRAALAGTAVLALVPGGLDDGSARLARLLLGAGLLVHALMILGELVVHAPTEEAARAARAIILGRYRALFLSTVVALGVVAPAIVLAGTAGAAWGLALSGGLVLAGLYAFEWCYVMGGQLVRNS